MSVSFAVVVGPTGSGHQWRDEVRRAEDQGYRTVCVPDTLWTISPFPALAAAATAAERIRLRTWVLAAPLRTPAATAREVSALQKLSDGRFELGIGTGRPDAAGEAERLGTPWGTGPQRLAHLEAVVSAVREQVAPAPPVVMAVGGPKGLAVAGRVASRVALALGPGTTEDQLVASAARTREAAPRAALTFQVMGVGDKVPEYLARQGLSADQLRAVHSPMLLPSDPKELADVVARHADQLGIDEVVVPGEYAPDVAPAIALLS